MTESGHSHRPVSGKNLGLAVFLNMGITLAEVAGGIISGSMALLSDALHNFSDVLSLAVSYFANRLSKKSATEKETFGFRRSEILAAFINSVTLIIMAVIIMVESVQRLITPAVVSANLVIGLAVAGIFVNGLSVLFLRKDSRNNMNIRSANIHLFSDMLTSVAVLAGGLAIKFLQWYRTDAIFSILIAIYMVFLSWGIFRSSLRIIMQFTPEDIDINRIANQIEGLPGVKNIHHIHVWQINEKDLMFEAHVDISEDLTVSSFEKILEEIQELLSRSGIYHSTIQPEFSVEDSKRMIH